MTIILAGAHVLPAFAAETDAPIPEAARQALDSCSLDRISSALAALEPTAEAMRNELETAKKGIEAVTQSLAKARELARGSSREQTIAALRPAFEALPRLIAYEGCRPHVVAFDELMTATRTPLVRDQKLDRAVKSCEIETLKSLVASRHAAAETKDRATQKNGEIVPVSAAFDSLDAAEATMTSGNVEASVAAVAEAETALSRSPLGACAELKASVDGMRLSIESLRGMEKALGPASSECRLADLRRLWKEASASNEPWAPNLLQRIGAAMSGCGARDAAWIKELDKEP